MGRVIRRTLVWLVLAILVTFVALVVDACQETPVSSGDSGKAFQVDTADVTVAVQPDATLQVTERLRFAFAGSFTGAYRDIPLASGVTLQDIAVSDRVDGNYAAGARTGLGSYDQPGSFGTTELPTGHGIRIVWHYSAQEDGHRTFTLRYHVRGAAKAYGNALVVPWAPWGDQWTQWLNHLTARTEIAKPASAGTGRPIQAWMRPDDLGEEPTVSDAGASIDARRLKPGQQVALTAAFPPGAVRSTSGASKRSGDGLAITRAAEAKAAEGGAVLRLASVVYHAIVPILVLWTALCGLVAFVLFRRSREHSTSVGKYVPGPPSPLPPAVGYALANEGGYTDRAVLATLLDLTDRGWFKAEPTEGKELDLRLSKAADRPAIETLQGYERTVLSFFDDLLGDEGPCELGKLKDRIPKHSSEWRGRWSKMNAELGEAGDDLISWDRDLRKARWYAAIVAVVGYAVVLVLLHQRSGFWAPAVAAGFAGLGLLFLMPSEWLQRRDEASIEAGAQWEAFARWTKDFPNLDDDPPATLALWRRILVYAVAFGTADRVIKSGRIPAPLADSDDGWSSGMLHGYTYGALSGSSFGSGFSSQVAAQSSSGGAGGGGGGGGFSGGGGGGAW